MRICTKRIGLTVLLALIALLSSVESSQAVPGDEPEKDVVRIGAIASLSGPAAEQGHNWLRGVELALSQINKDSKKVELLVEDDKTNPAQAASAFQKLHAIHKVDGVIGGTWDFLGEAIYPLAEKYKVPVITPTNPLEILSQEARSNRWVYTNGLSIAATRRAVLAFLKEHHPGSIVILVPNVPFGISHADMIESLAAELGITVLKRIDFDLEGFRESLRTLALNTVSLKPDAVFCLTDYAALDIYLATLQAQNFFPLVLTTQHLDEAFHLSKNVRRYKNVYGVYPAVHDVEFAKAFEAQFKEKAKVYAAEGYDATHVLFQLAQIDFRTAAPDVPAVNFEGAMGRYSIPPRGTQLVETHAQIMKIENGALAGLPHSPG